MPADRQEARSAAGSCGVRAPGGFGEGCELPAGHDGFHYAKVGCGSSSWPNESSAARSQVSTTKPENDGGDFKSAATPSLEMVDVLERVRARWKAVEALRIDDPFASKGMAALSEALHEAAEFIEANRWKGETS